MTPMTESAFQKRILQACQKEDRCHAIRISRMWAVMGGVPDLYIKHPNYPAVWLELKVNHRKGPSLAVGLSPLQRHFLRRENGAGGDAGWALLNQRQGEWALFAGRNSEVISVSLVSSVGFVEGRGDNSPYFDIIKILEAIIK